MTDPPFQSSSRDYDNIHDSANPFAPTRIEADEYPPKTELNGLFWGTFSIIILLSVALLFWSYLGVGCVVISLFAVARAILVQRTLASRNCHVLPDATYLLIISWFMTTGLMLATLIAFVIICVPIGITIGEGIATAIAGCLALLIFAGLFSASLKLPF